MNIDKVKRYGLTKISHDGIVTLHDICEWPEGDYVHYSDYAALIAKVRELEKDKKAQEVFDASRIKLIAVQADRITQLEKDKAVIFDGYAVHKKLMEIRPSTTCKLGCLTDILDAIAAIWRQHGGEHE